MKSSYNQLGAYIEAVNQLNEGMVVNELLGISNQKFFQNSHTNTIGIDLSTYRIVRFGEFAFNRATTRNGDKISIALRQGDDCIVSPSYRVFRSKDENVLNSEYLMMWFRRPEFDRYARFKSHGSAHEFFEWDQMLKVKLPIPHIDKQREIVKEYNTIQDRIKLNEQMIQKLEETAQAIYREWFVEGIDRENLPEGWKVGKLSDIALITMGQSPKGESYNESGEGCPLVNGPVEFGEYLTLKSKWTTDPKKYCKKGDLIFCVRGSTVGKNVIADDRYSIGRGVCSISSQYQLYLIQLIRFNLNEILKDVTGSTFPNIDRATLGNYLVVLSTDDRLQEFEDKTKPIFEMIEIKANENQKIKELKELLLSRLSKVN